ncbi:MAG TPA: LamG-like jellyroll fold domain-containing protein [Methylomirabilota bacterium]|nr:LamG-like jellyroll fold domain-containing protein [Methylomirabilota bacterium]
MFGSLSAADKVFRAGAYAIDITPTNFPVIVNAMFTERTATKAIDPLYARCLVLHDGTNRIAIAVVDTCMMPRDLIDQAKELARRETGIPTERMLVSATHTHSAPAAMGCLGSRADTNYARFLPGQIAAGIARAASNLGPAKIGWQVVRDSEHTHNRRWIRRPDRLLTDPFGAPNVRAHMHPGHESPDVIGPSGPVDPDLSIISIQSPQGRPIALLANYSMHYYDSPLLSADYYGRFASKIERLLGAQGHDPAFVGIMSQGTSGDLMWMDYAKPRQDIGYDAYAEALARKVHEACAAIQYHDWVPLVMREAKLNLSFRVPDAERLAWARKVTAELGGRLPRTLPEVYALEQIHLHERPSAELKLQALRIGTLGIAAIPNEVFAITGLKIKMRSPLQPTFNIELANGAEGYIPPPEQHKLGGYTTWPARTAGLETNAEPKIVEAVLHLLEEVAGAPRRQPIDKPGRYGAAVLASKPVAYWRMAELEGPRAHDSSPNNQHAIYGDHIAFFLVGLESNAFSEGTINRATHFAGGRMAARLAQLDGTYSIECWVWNGLPGTARPVTGYFLSRGLDGDKDVAGDHLGIGGTAASPGRLIFFNGNQRNQLLSGTTEIKLRTWNHIVLVRDGRSVRVYLNGNPQPEIAGEIDVTVPAKGNEIFIGGRNDNFANFEGKIDEVTVYDRALRGEEITGHYRASGFMDL